MYVGRIKSKYMDGMSWYEEERLRIVDWSKHESKVESKGKNEPEKCCLVVVDKDKDRAKDEECEECTESKDMKKRVLIEEASFECCCMD